MAAAVAVAVAVAQAAGATDRCAATQPGSVQVGHASHSRSECRLAPAHSTFRGTSGGRSHGPKRTAATADRMVSMRDGVLVDDAALPASTTSAVEILSTGAASESAATRYQPGQVSRRSID